MEVAATVQTVGSEAGEVVFAFEPSLPAATARKTPDDTRAAHCTHVSKLFITRVSPSE